MTALVIEAGDVTSDFLNTDVTNLVTQIPIYADGDLIILNYNLWNGTSGGDRTVSSWATGPNGETVVEVVNASGGTGVDAARIAIGYFIGSGSHTPASDITPTATANTRYGVAVVLVPAGEFDASTPISTAVDEKNGSSTTPNFDAFSANSGDTDGKLLVFVATNKELITGTPAGYTDLENLDPGRAAFSLGGRDAAVTSSESISASAGWTMTTEIWSTYAYIVRTFTAAVGNPHYYYAQQGY